jgi:hypothetical protein
MFGWPFMLTRQGLEQSKSLLHESTRQTGKDFYALLKGELSEEAMKELRKQYLFGNDHDDIMEQFLVQIGVVTLLGVEGAIELSGHIESGMKYAGGKIGKGAEYVFDDGKSFGYAGGALAVLSGSEHAIRKYSVEIENATWFSPCTKIGVFIGDKIGSKPPVAPERFNRNLLY